MDQARGRAQIDALDIGRYYCGALLVNAADLARPLVDPDIGHRGKRNRNGRVRIDNQPSQFVEPEAVLLAQPHPHIDLALVLAEVGGDLALHLVAH